MANESQENIRNREQSIGDRLKQIRKGKNLSQEAFAEILKTSKGYISEIERDLKMPGGDFILTLKRTMQVNINWLLSGKGQPHLQDEDQVVCEREPEYRDSSEVTELIQMTREIVTSETEYAASLGANIRSFHRAMNLERKVQDHERRIAQIEKERIRLQDKEGKDGSGRGGEESKKSVAT